MTNHQLIAVARKAWPFDSEPMDMGVESGIAWAICRGGVGVNGYVLIPAEGHPWSAGIPYREEDGWNEVCPSEYLLEVHGGITYGGGSCDGSDPRWLGFDTAHSGDMWDAEFDPHGVCRAGSPWDKQWTVELVIEEVRSLARQLASITQEER